MEKFYGFDLGDAESAISRLNKEGQLTPDNLEIEGAKSFITAYCMKKTGELLVGEAACYESDVTLRKIHFKSRFLTDKEAQKDIKGFASGVLGQLYLNGDLIKGEDTCFYIGCPAGWDKLARETYRQIFESVGYPPVKIISESRAALVSACQSKYLQVGYDILSKPVLVVDIGSSTTDFAYIASGKEEELQTGGEVFLGGGIMDEILLDEAIDASSDPRKIRKLFSESSIWEAYCQFAGRRLKEKYFTDEEYWQNNECVQNIYIRQSLLPTKLTLRMNKLIADRLLNKKVEKLGNKSFKEVFIESLQQVKANIKNQQPELVFLTGGVSKMDIIRQWCNDVFPQAVVIRGSEPEFSVSNGLAYCGKIDEELREFKKEVESLKDTMIVENLVSANISALYRGTVDTLVDPLLKEVALPVIERWRNGEIETLAEIDDVLEKEIDAYLHTDEARKLLAKPISEWLKKVSYGLEEYTMPICVKYNVPYSALNLNSYLALTDIDIKVDTKNIFAVEEITWLIDTIISIIVGLLCGGGGVAMIANGPAGIFAGAIISILVLALGKDRMQDAILGINIPKPMRRLFGKGYFEQRIDRLSEDVKNSLYENLEKEKNEEIYDRLVADISEQIETCLTKMAEVVEIPLA